MKQILNGIGNFMMALLAVAMLAVSYWFFVLQKGELKTAVAPLTSVPSTPTVALYPDPGPVIGTTPLPASTLTPLPTATVTPQVLTNGWYLYKDPDGEFSFAYPPDASISAGRNQIDSSKNIQIGFKLPGITDYQGMSIRVEPNPQLLPVNRIVARIYAGGQQPTPANLASQFETTTVSSLTAYKTTIPSTNTELTIILLHNDKVYIFAPVHGPATVAVNPKTLQLFYQILGTLSVKS